MIINYTLTVGNSWPTIFKDENYAGTIKNMNNYADKDIYIDAGYLNN